MRTQTRPRRLSDALKDDEIALLRKERALLERRCRILEQRCKNFVIANSVLNTRIEILKVEEV